LAKFRLTVIALVLALIAPFSPHSANALDPVDIASIFDRLTSGSNLADPSVVVMDEKTGQIVYEKNSYSLRKPASVIKLYTAAAAMTYLEPQQRFRTAVWVGTEAKSLVIHGSLDPWTSFSDSQAKKMNRTSIPRIEFNSLRVLREVNGENLRTATIYYSDLYSKEVSHIRSFFAKRGVKAIMKKVNEQKALELSLQEVLSSESPELQTIVAYALTWSDNEVSERVARIASRAAGYSLDDKGVAQTFAQVLSNLGIERGDQIIRDASGLSKENRVSAIQVGQLLLKLKQDSKFAPIIGGLPIGGLTGTLRNRFTDTAPQAIGLVKAKTGTLNGTANLAGYVEAGDREYIFVIIADRLKTSSRAEKMARATVDRILGKIAAPLLPQPSPQPQPEPAEIVIVTS